MATNAALATLEHLWGVLEPLGHSLALMGGISLAAWKHIRATRDVDVLIAIERPMLDGLIETLVANGYRPKKSPPIITVGDHSFVQFLYTPPGEFYDVQFDMLLAETELQRSAIARRIRGTVPGIQRKIDILRPDDLILFKLLADRLIDRADASELLRENRDEIDFSYLRHWVSELKLDAEFAEVWQDAFPDEAL